MRPADRDDTRETTDFDRPTVRVGDLYREEDNPAPLPRRHRRGPGLWLPVATFVVLLVAAAVVGRFVVPSAAGPTPQAGASRSGPVKPADPGAPTAAPSPTLSDLATAPKRPADALAGWATRVAGATDIPLVAVEAYGYAQLVLSELVPDCHIGWTTLAGIGKVESDHGRANGGALGANGRQNPATPGPPLDGKGGRPLVSDTDAGAFDADPTYDRVMGPLHLLPIVWVVYRIDADGDSILDPYDIDDAAATLARYLCSGPEDLNILAGWKTALARYHAGTQYETGVFQAADSYGQRTRSIG